MKRTVYILTLLLAGMIVTGAGLSQLTVSMTTEGPDYYADGSAVQVGETYLLVYVEDGAAFAGVNTDGTLVDDENNEIVTQSQAVDGSKCGFKAIQYLPEMYPEGGQFLIVLLDTRDNSGVVGGLVAQVGAGVATDAPASDAPRLNAVSVASTTAGGEPALVADTLSRASAETPPPIITAMEDAGDGVSLTIANVSETAVYEVQTATDLSSGQWTQAAGGSRLQVATAGATEVPASVDVPQGDKVRFFRVVVPGSN
ncbi:MAG: hypothetical protein R6V06_03050 [Kiritimatiellia bacterium]